MPDKVAAIVPALNEEKNIEHVLKVLLQSKDIDEVIVVDDGSEDGTARIARALGVKVVALPNNTGKANAMKEGIKATDAPIILFIDADLVNLSWHHISVLLAPVLAGKAVMSVGIRKRFLNISKAIIRIDPLLALSGQRAMQRFLLQEVPDKFIEKFWAEIALNYYCESKKLPVAYVDLQALKQEIKEKKWGIIKGFISRLQMIGGLIKVRIIIMFSKNKFTQ